MDRALEALYDSERSGSLSGSSPKIARWLGDIRDLLSEFSRTRHAAGRARTTRTQADAARTGNAGGRRARRASGSNAAIAQPRDAKQDQRDRAHGSAKSCR